MQFSNEQTNYKKSIIVECGFDWKEIIKRAYAQDCSDMLISASACLITHGHQDHCKCAKAILNSGKDIFATEETKEASRIEISGNGTIKPFETFCIAPKLYGYPFKVEHDFPNSLGFIIQCQETDETILFVNDCKYFKEDLSNYYFDYIFIECNYIDKFTRTIYEKAVKENDKVKMSQYKRVIDSHMGLERTKKILSSLKMNRCKGIFLMHLSDRNANEYKMKNEIKYLFPRIPVLVCQRNGGVK